MPFGTPAALLLLHLAAALPPESMAIRAYTVNEGLAHDHINNIFRDSHDFLWVCTDEGLSRWDGSRFVNLTVADGLPHIHVNDIIQTRDGHYWIATDAGVTYYRPEDRTRRLTVFKVQGPPESLFINAVLEEPGAGLLLATGDGLYRLEPATGNSARIDLPVSPGTNGYRGVNTLWLAPDKTLWIGASNGLFRRSPDGAVRHFSTADGLPHNFVDRLVAEPNGRLWVCTRHGLARLSIDPQSTRAVDLTITEANGLPSRDTRIIHFAPDGRRWIGTTGGLVEWVGGSPEPANFRVYGANGEFTDREVYVVISDPQGGLWLGTRRGGVMRLRTTGIQTFGPAEGLVTTGNDDLALDAKGAVCIAAVDDAQRAIRCFDGQQFMPAPVILPRALTATRPHPTHSTISDRRGQWWLSSGVGVFRSAPGLPDLWLLRDTETRRLFEDSQGAIWISTVGRASAGLRRWTQSGKDPDDVTPVIAPLLQGRRDITAIAETPGGRIWVGLERPGGLLRLQNGRAEPIEGMPPGTVETILRDKDGRLWIATTEGGLARVDDPATTPIRVRIYNRNDGLSSNEVRCLLEDLEGRIYAGGVRGVDRIDPSIGTITHFGTADGLAAGDIRSAIRDPGGALWFLSKRGLSRLRPMENQIRWPLAARITSMRVAGEPYPVNELGQREVSADSFSFRRNSLQIDFSALTFQSPEQLRYQFRLLGAGGDWSPPSSSGSVQFSNLAPGSYTFLARVLDGGVISGAAPASFAFIIAPPFWQRWWFLLTCAGLSAGLALFIHRMIVEQKVGMERVRSRIAADLHDDVGASLARVAVMSEALKTRYGAADPDAQRMLGEIAGASRDMVGGMSDIVWSIDPGKDDVAGVVSRLRAFGSDVLEPRGIVWNCEGPADPLDQSLPPDQRRHFFLLFKEAIHNIAKHANAQNVTLRISALNGWVAGVIEDDGCGLPQSRDNGLGLASMQNRAANLDGSVSVESRPGGGTQISVRFPARREKRMNMRLRRLTKNGRIQ